MNIQEVNPGATTGRQAAERSAAEVRQGPERFVTADSTAGSADGARTTEGRVLERAAVEKVLGEAQGELSRQGVSLKFKLMDENDQYQVEVRDKDSGRVIRKIPADEVINLSKSMKTLAGALLDRNL